MQDTDVKLPDGNPLVHWTMYNIPASATSLPDGMTDAFRGSYGPNMRGATSPYVGPNRRRDRSIAITSSSSRWAP